MKSRNNNVEDMDNLSFEDFRSLVNEGEKIAKGPDIFYRSLDIQDKMPNELCILRRWNSHTPSIYNVLGGGYFLMWQNKGTIIDPGCGFLKLFRNKTNYNFGHVNSVITTHDHVDHSQDLGLLIILLRQYNKWLVDSDKVPKIWDMVVSYGVADEYVSMFNHPDNAPFLFWQRVLTEKSLKIEYVKNVPKFLINAEKKKLLMNEKYLESYLERAGKSYEKIYSYELNALRANHKELLGASTTFGVKFILKENLKDVLTMVISGDTAINADNKETDGSQLLELYNGANLLILHVGGLEKPDEPRYDGDHLGYQGVVEILSQIKQKPKLVILTEWGYEFGRLGVNGRTNFTRFVAEKLNEEHSEYYAAVKNNDTVNIKENSIPIIPADINLRIHLPDMFIYVEDENEPVDYHKVVAEESLESIYYYKV
jgi:ribonuclease BN (tRNA processing enzyme)